MRYLFDSRVVVCALLALLAGTILLTGSGQSFGTPFRGTPQSLPGILQAEDFNEGGEGVAYHDHSPSNEGGQYRSGGVDIAAASDAGGGYTLGWVGAGEWLTYTVNIGASGSYDLEFRVASAGAGGTFHLEVNGVDRTGSITIPNTGGWQSWATVPRTGIALGAGQQVWRLVMDSYGASGAVGNFNYIRVAAVASTASSTPFGGTPAPLPGTIQAENFDEGGSGVAYFDTTAGNAGGQYRSTDVDIQTTTDSGGGHNVGWLKPAEWLKYTVAVSTPGTYALDIRVAAAVGGATFHVEANGIDVTGPLTFPNTGGYQSWRTVTVPGVKLTSGTQVLRVVIDGANSSGGVGNLNYIRAVAGSNSSPSSTPFGGTPAALPGVVQAEEFDNGGSGVAYVDTTAGNAGGAFRQTDVDIQGTSDRGAGYNIGWLRPGEWLKYTVSVASAGTYSIEARVAASLGGARFHVEVNGVDRTGPLTFPTTGGTQAWTTIVAPGVSLGAGPQVWAIVIDSTNASGGVGNINYLRVSAASGATEPMRGPYVQHVSDSSTVVVWTTRQTGTAQVRYAASSGGVATAAALTRSFPAAQTGLASDIYQHEALLTGLAAGTQYSYDVLIDGVDLTPGQDTFRSAPARGTGSVRFIAFGDSGVGSTAQRDLAVRMAADVFDLAIHGGDVAYGTSSGLGGASYPQYEAWVFDIYGSWLRSRPFFPSIGNHDDEIAFARAYKDVFVLPENGSSPMFPDHAERYYSYDYGPVHFVALDTELAFQDASRRTAQLQWLDADLASTAQPWKIVYFHRSPYSAGTHHGSDLAVRKAFGPLFERHGVDLVISAHEHNYERSIPWREFEPTGEPVVYVVSGGGGGPIYPAGRAAWTAASIAAHHYVKVSVSGCSLSGQAIGVTGAALDSFSIDRCSASAAEIVEAEPRVGSR
ncbi:MAG TPA: carbohydrate-binding protein [Vicinamibacterales bacterium]|nr:carbohydrate-binding protein [Vicinamibacterales bacterium]